MEKQEFVRKTGEYMKLEDGWDGYFAKPTTLKAVTVATYIFDRFPNVFYIAPGSGGVMLEYRTRCIRLEIDIDEEGRIGYLRTEESDPDKDISMSDVFEMLGNMSEVVRNEQGAA